jgi:hypothetical protein
LNGGVEINGEGPAGIGALCQTDHAASGLFTKLRQSSTTFPQTVSRKSWRQNEIKVVEMAAAPNYLTIQQ